MPLPNKEDLILGVECLLEDNKTLIEFIDYLYCTKVIGEDEFRNLNCDLNVKIEDTSNAISK